jgi:hypothetical protein
VSRKRSAKSDFAHGVCDKIKDNKPDMYNSVPKRVVLKEEAERMGWTWFWDKATACSQGHIAARYVSNTAMCVDCNRLALGKPAIYPNTTGSDLTADVPEYVKPIADDTFQWIEPKRRQFFTAWINTGSVPKALDAIGAQPSHLIRILDEDQAFKSEFERTRDTAVAQSQLWKAEDLAMGGSDRATLVHAASKFPDSFGQRAKSDLGARQVRSPEQIRAAFTRIVQRLVGSPVSEVGLGEKSTGSPPAVSGGEAGDAAPGAGGVAAPDGGGGVLLEDDPNSDLV